MTPKVSTLVQERLALEHHIVWSLEAIAARNDSLTRQAGKGLKAHRSAREELRQRLLKAENTPVTPPAAHDPGFLSSEGAMRAQISDLEQQIASTEVELIALVTGSDRRISIASLITAARSAVDWGAPAKAFPGLD